MVTKEEVEDYAVELALIFLKKHAVGVRVSAEQMLSWIEAEEACCQCEEEQYQYVNETLVRLAGGNSKGNDSIIVFRRAPDDKLYTKAEFDDFYNARGVQDIRWQQAFTSLTNSEAGSPRIELTWSNVHDHYSIVTVKCKLTTGRFQAEKIRVALRTNPEILYQWAHEAGNLSDFTIYSVRGEISFMDGAEFPRKGFCCIIHLRLHKRRVLKDPSWMNNSIERIKSLFTQVPTGADPMRCFSNHICKSVATAIDTDGIWQLPRLSLQISLPLDIGIGRNKLRLVARQLDYLLQIQQHPTVGSNEAIIVLYDLLWKSTITLPSRVLRRKELHEHIRARIRRGILIRDSKEVHKRTGLRQPWVP